MNTCNDSEPTPKLTRYALIKQDPAKLAKLSEYNKMRYQARKNAGIKQRRYNKNENSQPIKEESKQPNDLVFYRSCMIENKDITIYCNTENKNSIEEFYITENKKYIIPMEQAKKVSSLKIIDSWIDLADAKKESPQDQNKIASIFFDIMKHYKGSAMFSINR
jgi:hypothetical protein